MSETPVGSDEEAVSADAPLQDALIEFTGCVGEALEDVCSYGLTIGETYVPFDPDDDDEADPACDPDGDGFVCSQAWVRVMSVTPTHQTDSFDNGDCGAVMRIELEVGVLRCVEVPEDGNAPTASNVLVASLQAMADMRAIYCAAMACEVWDTITSGQWTPSGPLGGQYGGIWTFTVEV